MWHFITLFAVAHSVIISASGEIDFPYHSLIQFGLRGHSQEAKSMMVATTSTAKTATVVVKPTKDVRTIDGSFTRSAYDLIFPHGNRNAASHRWFNYVYNKAEAGNAFDPDFAEVNKYYCPISGSPTSGSNLAQITLPRVTGGKEAGSFSFCCSPCYCDMMDFVKVDTISVKGKEYRALVIGDPCTNPAIINNDGTLNVQFADPWDPSNMEDLATAAPDVICDKSKGAYKLQNATLSENQHIVIGLLHDSPGVTFSQEEIDCATREEEGFVGGMGSIFRELAKLNPITTG
jgi:hypothetical protein